MQTILCSLLKKTERERERKIKVVILVVYVDDIVVIKSDGEEIDRLKEFLRTQFKIKDLELQLTKIFPWK